MSKPKVIMSILVAVLVSSVIHGTIDEPLLQPTYHDGSVPDWIPEDGSPVTVTANFCMVVATYGDIVMLDCGDSETHITNEPDKIDGE